MDTDKGFHLYGTPLPPLDEDDVPAKKRIYAEDQIVTDEHGKRRFHGAFTGGFSAGFWNTVGSLHGWTPQTFKSSRSEKAAQLKTQRPEDFMDDEDLGEFGIAPQRIQASEDFAKDRKGETVKRKFLQRNDGPIPGQPVLAMLLKPVKDKAAVRILKAMGWRPGQGVGPRLTRKQKKTAKMHNKRELYIWQRYCDDDDKQTIMKPPADVAESTEESDDDDEITFAPDDMEPLFLKSKTDTFGLGYTGLLGASTSESSTNPEQKHKQIDALEFLGKNNKKISIAGQAFGVGALEEEDADIYARDDMSNYDFSLSDKKPQKKIAKPLQDRNVIEGFVEDTSPPIYAIPFIVNIPANYKPRKLGARKSRFEPLSEERQKQLSEELKVYAVGRHNLDAEKRGQLLGEEQPRATTTSIPVTIPPPPTPPASSLHESQKKQDLRAERAKELLERITMKSNNFTKAGLITSDGEEKSITSCTLSTTDEQLERQDLLKKAANKTKSLGKQSDMTTFKPFINNEAKQERYEKFLETKLKAETEVAEFLKTLQPVHMSEWDRAMEVKEFIQARNIYKPLVGSMSDRFTSEAAEKSTKGKDKEKEKEEKKPSEKKVEMKRTKTMWKPNALLCKRFNIAEPFGGTMPDEQLKAQKPKLSVFDYLETSVNKRENFHTPVIIPKHIEKPKAIVKTREELFKTATPSTTPSSTKTPPPTLLLQQDTKPQASSRDTTATKTKKYVPKTELEKKVEANKDKPLWEKTELYKAIFDDSDNDDVEATHPSSTPSNANDVPQKLDISTTETAKPLSAAAANLLRNTSPPRGIFAALFTTPTPDKLNLLALETPAASNININQKAKIVFQSRKERKQQILDSSEHSDQSDMPSTYGPRLPKTLEQKINATASGISNVAAGATASDRHRNTSGLLLEKDKAAKRKTSVSEEWIERSVGSIDESTTDSSASSSNADRTFAKKSKTKRKSKKMEKKSKKKDKKHDRKHKSKKKKIKKDKREKKSRAK